MINSVTLVGRITKDLEVKYSQSGVAVCRFNLAVNRNFKSSEGGQEADFPTILTFKKTAENVANHLQKGSLVGVTGRIQTGSYEGQDGKKVYTTEILAESVQFLEPRSAREDGGQQQAPPTQQPTQQQSYTPPQGSQQYQNQQPQQQSQDPFANNNGRYEEDPDLPF